MGAVVGRCMDDAWCGAAMSCSSAAMGSSAARCTCGLEGVAVGLATGALAARCALTRRQRGGVGGSGRAGAGSSLHFNGAAGGRAVTAENAPPGTLVVRGPDWKWDDQVPARPRRMSDISPSFGAESVGSGGAEAVARGRDPIGDRLAGSAVAGGSLAGGTAAPRRGGGGGGVRHGDPARPQWAFRRGPRWGAAMAGHGRRESGSGRERERERERE